MRPTKPELRVPKVGDLILTYSGCYVGVITNSYEYNYPSFAVHIVFEGKLVRISTGQTDIAIAR